LLEVTGEIDISAIPLLEEAVRILPRDAAAGLIVSLAGVRFMDAAGLGFLVRIKKACRASGRTFVVRDVSARVRRLLRLAQLEDILASGDFPTAPAAGGSLSSRGSVGGDVEHRVLAE
jgi:anti-anti-sigma factor